MHEFNPGVSSARMSVQGVVPTAKRTHTGGKRARRSVEGGSGGPPAQRNSTGGTHSSNTNQQKRRQWVGGNLQSAELCSRLGWCYSSLHCTQRLASARGALLRGAFPSLRRLVPCVTKVQKPVVPPPATEWFLSIVKLEFVGTEIITVGLTNGGKSLSGMSAESLGASAVSAEYDMELSRSNPKPKKASSSCAC